MNEVAARELIAEHLAVPVGLVVDQAEFRELGADSLDLVTLTMHLEEAFDLYLPEEQIEYCTTVSHALQLLRHAHAARHRELQPTG